MAYGQKQKPPVSCHPLSGRVLGVVVMCQAGPRLVSDIWRLSWSVRPTRPLPDNSSQKEKIWGVHEPPRVWGTEEAGCALQKIWIWSACLQGFCLAWAAFPECLPLACFPSRNDYRSHQLFWEAAGGNHVLIYITKPGPSLSRVFAWSTPVKWGPWAVGYCLLEDTPGREPPKKPVDSGTTAPLWFPALGQRSRC